MKNLFPPPGSHEWQSITPYPGASPVFEQTEAALIKRSNGSRNCFGRWQAPAAEGVTGGQYYSFSVTCLTFDLRHKKANIHVLLTWKNSEGALIQRDYIEGCDTTDGILFERVLPAPEDSAIAVIELCLKWSETGYVHWINGKFHEAPPIVERKIRVASAYAQSPGGKAPKLQAILDVLDKVGAEKPDIVCLGETVLSPGIPFSEAAVTIDGPEIMELGKKAKQYNMYIVVGLNLLENGFYYNTAVLINRSGEVQGIYRKVHLPLAEAEMGYTPGDEACVFETDFGKIGMMICWDMGYPELARMLAKNGAEIILVPTMWNAPLQARSRAVDNLVFMVLSARGSDGPAGENGKVCFTIDPLGQMIASCKGGETDGYCIADVELDKVYKSNWYSVGPCYGEHRIVRRNERRFDLY